MVYPVTGPFTRAETALGPANIYGFKPQWLAYNRSWYRQRRPYNLPLSFTYQRKEVVSFVPNAGYQTGQTANSGGAPAYPNASPASWFPNTYNKAHARFVSQLKPDTAGLGVGLAQRKQAVDMIALRAGQLIKFVRELKSFRLGAAAKTLGLDPKVFKANKKLRRGSKNFANNFLEVHFGWSPLVGDIGSAVEVLQKGVPPTVVRGSASDLTKTSSSVVDLYEGYFNDSEVKATWSIQAQVVVSNPNLFLANQLGFVNPGLIAYDAAPFSFVLNWFINIEQFLSSFTDFWGLTLENPFITSHTVSKRHERQYRYRVGPSNQTLTYPETRWQTIETKRTPGSPPGPSLRIRNPWVVSPTRGLTAISLLIQKLKKP